jgi:hypothetical protein
MRDAQTLQPLGPSVPELSRWQAAAQRLVTTADLHHEILEWIKRVIARPQSKRQHRYGLIVHLL